MSACGMDVHEFHEFRDRNTVQRFPLIRATGRCVCVCNLPLSGRLSVSLDAHGSVVVRIKADAFDGSVRQGQRGGERKIKHWRRNGAIDEIKWGS